MNSQTTKKTVLLIEDNESDIELAKEAFSHVNTNVELVSIDNGIEGLDYVFKRNGYEHVASPDLILLDLNIPKLDGKGVLEIIKKDRSLHSIPVIILTGSQQERDKHSSLDLFANCFMLKPNNGDDFIEMIAQIERFWLANKYLSH